MKLALKKIDPRSFFQIPVPPCLILSLCPIGPSCLVWFLCHALHSIATYELIRVNSSQVVCHTRHSSAHHGTLKTGGPAQLSCANLPVGIRQPMNINKQIFSTSHWVKNCEHHFQWTLGITHHRAWTIGRNTTEIRATPFLQFIYLFEDSLSCIHWDIMHHALLRATDLNTQGRKCTSWVYNVS